MPEPVQRCLHRGEFPGARVTRAKSGDRVGERPLKPKLLGTPHTLSHNDFT